MGNLDLDCLKTVLMVAKMESFSLTAFEIPCSQSSVSRRVKNVEDELGIKFFIRPANTGNVVLTEEGANVIPIIERIVIQCEELYSAGLRKSQQSFRIFFGLHGGIKLTALGIENMRIDIGLKLPNISFLFQEGSINTLMSKLSVGQLDAVLYMQYNWNHSSPYIYLKQNTNLEVFHIGSQTLSVAVSAAHSLASCTSVRMRELSQENFIFPEDIRLLPANDIPFNYMLFLQACHRNNFTPKIYVSGRSNRAIPYHMVSENNGILLTALPDRLCENPGIRFVPISDAPIHADFYLITQKGKVNDCFVALKNLLTDYFQTDDFTDLIAT